MTSTGLRHASTPFVSANDPFYQKKEAIFRGRLNSIVVVVFEVEAGSFKHRAINSELRDNLTPARTIPSPDLQKYTLTSDFPFRNVLKSVSFGAAKVVPERWYETAHFSPS